VNQAAERIVFVNNGDGTVTAISSDHYRLSEAFVAPPDLVGSP
jgi:hypothetical protein